MGCPRVCFRLLRLKTIYQSSQSQASQIYRAAAQDEKLGHWMLDWWSGESHCFEDSQAANCLRRSWECRAFHWVEAVTFTSSEPSTVPCSWCCQWLFGSLVKEVCDCRLPVVAECSLILAWFYRPILCFNSFILKLQSLAFH